MIRTSLTNMARPVNIHLRYEAAAAETALCFAMVFTVLEIFIIMVQRAYAAVDESE